MPHLILEYSAPLRPLIQSKQIVPIAHRVMVESGLFGVPDIKTRAYPAEDFAVGEKCDAGSFVHVTVMLLEGRTSEQKQALTTAIRDTLAPLLEGVDQLSVDIRDMVKEAYRKHVRP